MYGEKRLRVGEEVDFELELTCAKCGGTGKIKVEVELANSKKKVIDKDCTLCNGHGSMPSHFGREVLDFVRRNLLRDV